MAHCSCNAVITILTLILSAYRVASYLRYFSILTLILSTYRVPRSQLLKILDLAGYSAVTLSKNTGEYTVREVFSDIGVWTSRKGIDFN